MTNELNERFSPKQIKQAIGIASDKRYAGGNMTGATKTIEKLARGLSDHPQVKAVLKRVNEDLEEGAQILAHGGKGQYKAVTKNGSVSITFKGKTIATGDFDRGADAFFLSWKDMQKGKKNSRPEGTAFDTAQDMVDFFAKKKITESLDPADLDMVATDKDKAGAKMNIIMQLRKAADVKGNMPIQFADGKKAKLPPKVIELALKKFASFRKPDTKEKLQTAMGKSYKDMVHALKTMREEVELDEGVDKAKIQKQIDQAEKYLKTFFGNTSSVKMKKVAIQRKIDKLKKQLNEAEEEYCTCGCECGKEVCESCGKPHKPENIDESKMAGWIAFYNGKKVEIKKSEANDLYGAKMKAAKMLKVPKSKMGLLAIKPGYNEEVVNEEVQQDLQEAPNYKLYHNTFSGAVQEAIAVAKKKGFDVDEDDWSDKVATGPKKPSKDKTNSYSIKLMKKGKPVRQMLQIQVYNMGAKYELNCYVQ